MSTEVSEVVQVSALSAPRTQMTPPMLLQMAVEQGADLDRLERLMALQERWEAGEARKAFWDSMSAFKAEPLTIVKDKRVVIPHRDGGGATEYMHATLGSVCAQVIPVLGKYGLSHRWDVRREQARVHVTCVVTHRLGHSESISMEGPLDDSGKKNAIQQQASTVTYLQRYTLLSVLGLATSDGDDDGAEGAGEDDQPQRTMEEHRQALAKIGRDQDALAYWHKRRLSLSGTPQYQELRTAVEERRRELARQP